MATSKEKIKFKMFRVIAKRIPKDEASRGIIINPTVVQDMMNAVTARRLTPACNSSPPAT